MTDQPTPADSRAREALARLIRSEVYVWDGNEGEDHVTVGGVWDAVDSILVSDLWNRRVGTAPGAEGLAELERDIRGYHALWGRPPKATATAWADRIKAALATVPPEPRAPSTDPFVEQLAEAQRDPAWLAKWAPSTSAVDEGAVRYLLTTHLRADWNTDSIGRIGAYVTAQSIDDTASAILARPTAPADAQGDAAAESGLREALRPFYLAACMLGDGRQDEEAVVLSVRDLVSGRFVIQHRALRMSDFRRLREISRGLSAAPAPEADTPSAGEVGRWRQALEHAKPQGSRAGGAPDAELRALALQVRDGDADGPLGSFVWHGRVARLAALSTASREPRAPSTSAVDEGAAFTVGERVCCVEGNAAGQIVTGQQYIVCDVWPDGTISVDKWPTMSWFKGRFARLGQHQQGRSGQDVRLTKAEWDALSPLLARPTAPADAQGDAAAESGLRQRVQACETAIRIGVGQTFEPEQVPELLRWLLSAAPAPSAGEVGS